MSADVTNMYTDGRYLENNPTWDAEYSGYKADMVAKLLARKNLKPATVAEVGCGAGKILQELATKLDETTRFAGYEISPQAFELTKEVVHPRIAFHLEDLVVRKGEPYDLLLAIDVIEHVEDYIGFCRGLRDKAKWKAFYIPLEMTANLALKPSVHLDLRKSVGHLHHFSKATALATLEHAGYEIVDYFYVKSPIPPTSVKTHLMRGLRRMIFKASPDFAVRLLGDHSLMVLAR